MPSRPDGPSKAQKDAAREAAREAGRDASKEAGSGGAAAKPRKWPKSPFTKAELKKYRQLLDDLRSGQVRTSKDLAREALKGSGQDFSVDHMADHGTDNFEQDFTLGLLEGKTETLRDVEDALAKIDGRGEMPFGLCEGCADLDESAWPRGCETCPWIPKGRLDVVPYARLCIRRQEEAEDRP